MSLQLHAITEMGVSFSGFQLENGGSAKPSFTGEGEVKSKLAFHSKRALLEFENKVVS